MPNARCSLRLSVPPLWLIGVCLFLPTVRACSKMESPATLMRGDHGFFVALLSPYLVAQLLGILAIVALARGRVGRGLGVSSAILTLLAAASTVTLAVVGLGERSPHFTERLWSCAAGIAFLGGVLVMWRARRTEPFERLARLHAAYTIFTLPLAALLCRIAFEDGLHKIGYGAPLFLAAEAALAVLAFRTLSSRE